jgi:hypothetical protein
MQLQLGRFLTHRLAIDVGIGIALAVPVCLAFLLLLAHPSGIRGVVGFPDCPSNWDFRRANECPLRPAQANVDVTDCGHPLIESIVYAQVKTGSDGRFSVDVPAGNYCVEAQGYGQGERGHGGTAITVGAKGRADVRIVLIQDRFP